MVPDKYIKVIELLKGLISKVRFNEPIITIGMPTKNSVHYIQEVLRTMESLEYSREKINVVFVDDYSTDGTFEVLAEWKTRMEKQYRNIVLIQEQTNIPQARNLCVKNMEGDFILFWDSDVIPPRGLLKEMIFAMEKDPLIAIIGADYVYGDPSKSYYKPLTRKMGHAVYMGFTLIRREVFEKVGGFNEDLSVGEDTEFGIRVWEKTNYKILWAPEPVLHLKRGAKKRGTYRKWLAYNFNVRAKEYYRTFTRLPWFLKARVIYYLGFPWIVSIGLASILLALPAAIILISLYIAGGTFFTIRLRGLKYGTLIWMTFNLPTGLALAHGILKEVVKELALRLLKSQNRGWRT